MRRPSKGCLLIRTGLLVLLLASPLSISAKTHFAVNLPVVGGYRDTTWEIGTKASVELASSNFFIRLGAPLFVRLDNGQNDPWDWDERGDIGRVLEKLHIRLGRYSQIRAGMFTRQSMGLGELVSDYSTTLSHRHIRSGLMARIGTKSAGLSVFLADFTDPLMAGMVGVDVRPFGDVGGALGLWEMAVQLLFVRTNPHTQGMQMTFALLGYHPFVGKKAVTIGPWWAVRQGIYTFGMRASGSAKRFKWEVSAGVRLSRKRFTTPLVDTLFLEEQYGFLNYGPKVHLWLSGNPDVSRSVRPASEFGEFSFQIKGSGQIWARVDFDRRPTALYAGGGTWSFGKFTLRGAFAIRGAGMRVYSGEATYMIYGPLYFSVVGSHSCAYEKKNNNFEKINVFLGALGVYSRW